MLAAAVNHATDAAAESTAALSLSSRFDGFLESLATLIDQVATDPDDEEAQGGGWSEARRTSLKTQAADAVEQLSNDVYSEVRRQQKSLTGMHQAKLGTARRASLVADQVARVEYQAEKERALKQQGETLRE
eukprot:2486710-Prymnesium_polylepis.1